MGQFENAIPAKTKKSCSYIRRDGTYCPEQPLNGSHYCFWHDSTVDKINNEVKEKLEKKVKEDPNCEGYQLENVDLSDAWLTDTVFDDAVLRKAKLHKGHLFGISLKGADLFKSNFSSANLRHAKLNQANLMGMNIENAKLANINWGEDYIILQEIQAMLALKQKQKVVAKSKFKDAEEIYLVLKNHFSALGDSKLVGKFFYREMITQQRQMPLFSAQRFFMKLADVSCGYGEKVFNILSFSLFVIIMNAAVYSFSGITDGDTIFRISLDNGVFGVIKTFFHMLYFSTVTFTTLGYGDFSPATPLTALLAGLEAFMGAFLVALFVISVYKNMMSR
ncbi:pentapeptide repeat-containing protein [candidate division KSB1 bacterium]|nr:pentapeptide repeat-containing protein [candidate division KSB1 bacterium]